MSRITEILHTLVKNFASLEEDSDGLYWWGHDTNLGNQEEAFKQAEQAITDLLNEAIGEDEPYPMSYQGGGTQEYRERIDREKEIEVFMRNQLRQEIRTKLGLTTKEDK